MNLKKTQALIRKALNLSRNPVVGFSGGKDSTAVLHLVRHINPKVPAIFHNTGVEAPETIKFCSTISNLIETKPDRTFWQIVDKYGWPQQKDKAKRHGNACCYYLKEKPLRQAIKKHNFDLIFTGLTTAESHQRFMVLKYHGTLYFQKLTQTWRCHAIADWSENDVWHYIKSNNVPYNTGYDTGWHRCGCMPCTAHKNWETRLQRENPRLYQIVIKRRLQNPACGEK